MALFPRQKQLHTPGVIDLSYVTLSRLGEETFVLGIIYETGAVFRF